jgi:hypothetical protein
MVVQSDFVVFLEEKYTIVPHYPHKIYSKMPSVEYHNLNLMPFLSSLSSAQWPGLLQLEVPQQNQHTFLSPSSQFHSTIVFIADIHNLRIQVFFIPY